jgi:hypothetical protein
MTNRPASYIAAVNKFRLDVYGQARLTSEALYVNSQEVDTVTTDTVKTDSCNNIQNERNGNLLKLSSWVS